MTRPEGAWRQRLPGGAARERLREKGQFWTPDWIADGMVSFALGDEGKEVFDPAAGSGAFFRAAQRLRAGVRLLGTEIAPEVLDGTLPAEVEIRDFVLDPPERRFEAIVANPPYIRHHRLGASRRTGASPSSSPPTPSRAHSRPASGARLRAGFGSTA